ncbi:unnamed protein product [Ilex paraguariensis]|uniref:Uncharacterized protein n=1 Tax=Ilex paraguariensis TaxID=185542 RepID=A0ABC8TSC9_9AQUA
MVAANQQDTGGNKQSDLNVVSSGGHIQGDAQASGGRQKKAIMDEEMEKLWSNLKFSEKEQVDLNISHGDNGSLREKG